jgi:lipopolysaccharide export LptBFGC system permease protein LptF
VSNFGRVVRSLALGLAGFATFGSGLCTVTMALELRGAGGGSFVLFGLLWTLIFGLVAWWLLRGLREPGPPSR